MNAELFPMNGDEEAILSQQKLYDSNPIPASLWLANSIKMIDCNQSVVDLVGAKNKQDYLKNTSTFLPKYQPCGTPSVEKITELFKRAVESGKVREVWMHTHASGEIIPGEVILIKVELYGETMIAAYLHDLRPLRDADEKIREAMNMTQILLDTSPALIEIWDSEDNFVDCNRQMLEMFGLSSKEEFSNRYDMHVPKMQPCGTLSTELEFQHRITVLSEGSVRYEWTCQLPSGELIPFEVMAFCIEHGDRRLIVSYSNDVRPIKLAMKLENEREMSERMRLMFDATPLVIEYWDKNYDAIDCNQTCLDYYGYPDKEAYRKNIFRHSPAFQPDGTPSRYLWNTHLEMIFRDGTGRFEFVERLRGRDSYTEVQGVRVKHRDEIIVVTYKNDITQLREADEQRRLKEIAEVSSQAKSIFLARMSHEIRTPITAVLGISEVQLQDTNLPPAVEESFAKIYSSADMLLNLINDILDLSKIEAGKLTIVEEEYDVASMVSDVANLSLTHTGCKDIKFSLQVDENLPNVLIGDFLRIEQIINNLVSNAFKYTETGNIEMRLQSEYLEDCVMLTIVISDTGYGMTAQQLSAINDNYSRFHERDKKFISGAGLGIPIVFSLLEIMGGNIYFESEVGKGTCATVRIPQKTSGTEVLGKENAYNLQQLESASNAIVKRFKFTPEPMPYGKVLVVDDVEANLFVAAGLLKFYDLHIETCSNGFDAINKVKSGNVYDIIFMDHMMPGINGVEAMQRIRELGYQYPVVVLTANAMIGQAEEFISKGFDGFVSKPIQTKSLNTILVKFIRDKQLPEVIAAAKSVTENTIGHQPQTIDSFMQSEEITNKLRAEFIRGQKHAVTEIQKAIGKGNLEKAHRLAHNLKSASALIDENMLASSASFIESDLEGNNVPSAESLEIVDKHLKRVLAKIGETDSPMLVTGEFDKEKAAVLFDTLEPLLSSRSVDSLDYVDELRKIPETAALARLIEDFEFVVAAKVLGALRIVLET